MGVAICNLCGRDRALGSARLIAHPDSRGVVRARLCALCIRELGAKGYVVAGPKLVDMRQISLLTRGAFLSHRRGSGEDVT